MAVSDRNTDWRKKLREEIKGKERTEIERVKMPELEPTERIKSQRLEVNTGLTEEMALRGSKEMYGLCKSDLYGRLSGRDRYSGIY